MFHVHPVLGRFNFFEKAFDEGSEVGESFFFFNGVVFFLF